MEYLLNLNAKDDVVLEMKNSMKQFESQGEMPNSLQTIKELSEYVDQQMLKLNDRVLYIQNQKRALTSMHLSIMS